MKFTFDLFGSRGQKAPSKHFSIISYAYQYDLNSFLMSGPVFILALTFLAI